MNLDTAQITVLQENIRRKIAYNNALNGEDRGEISEIITYDVIAGLMLDDIEIDSISEQELSQRINKAISDYISGGIGGWDLSLDQPFGDSDNGTLLDIMSADSLGLEDTFIEGEDLEAGSDLMSGLNLEVILRYIASKDFDEFAKAILTRNQIANIDLLREAIEEYGIEELQVRGRLVQILGRNIAISLRRVFLYIKMYSEFILVNPFRESGGWTIYTTKTAPYFFREDLMAKDHRRKFNSIASSDPIIIEYITTTIISILNDDEALTPIERLAMRLVYLKGISIEQVAEITGLKESTIRYRLQKATNILTEKNLDIQQLIIDFLSLPPVVRNVSILLNRGLTVPQIAYSLRITPTAVYTAKSKLTLATRDFRPARRVALEEFSTRISLETLSEQQRALLGNLDFKAMFADSLSLIQQSTYATALFQLWERGETELVKLYMVLTYIPDKDLVALITGYNSETIKEKIGELKRLILPQGHPALNKKEYISWIEVNNIGRQFLIDDTDRLILQTIRELSAEGIKATKRNIQERTGVNPQYRLGKLKELFELGEIEFSAYPDAIYNPGVQAPTMMSLAKGVVDATYLPTIPAEYLPLKAFWTSLNLGANITNEHGQRVRQKALELAEAHPDENFILYTGGRNDQSGAEYLYSPSIVDFLKAEFKKPERAERGWFTAGRIATAFLSLKARLPKGTFGASNANFETNIQHIINEYIRVNGGDVSNYYAPKTNSINRTFTYYNYENIRPILQNYWNANLKAGEEVLELPTLEEIHANEQ